jgi:ABC-type nitrate/sulfonate/bicarbonate transport system substrate-binding protein
VYIYLNRGWAEKNHDAAVAFMRSIVEASDLINKDPGKASDLVAAYLKLDKDLTASLMKKLSFDVRLDNASLENFMTIQDQLRGLGKLAKSVDMKDFVRPEYLKAARPQAVNLTESK